MNNSILDKVPSKDEFWIPPPLIWCYLSNANMRYFAVNCFSAPIFIGKTAKE